MSTRQTADTGGTEAVKRSPNIAKRRRRNKSRSKIKKSGADLMTQITTGDLIKANVKLNLPG